jgi:hypothetical protein
MDFGVCAIFSVSRSFKGSPGPILSGTRARGDRAHFKHVEIANCDGQNRNVKKIAREIAAPKI